MKAEVWGFNNSELIKEDYKSSLSAFGIANPEQRGTARNPEQRGNPEQGGSCYGLDLWLEMLTDNK